LRDRAPAEDLTRALALTEQIDKEVDFLAWELRPAVLDDLGLAVALPQFVRDWSTHHGVFVEVRVAMPREQVSRDAELTFYRIAQESLNNVAKHAHATRADVMLEQRDGSLVLVVEDDGIGFDPAEAHRGHGIGLIGMRERASLVRATLEIESSPGNGTSVFLRYPLGAGTGRTGIDA
jgi:signal transduction histidine kinase